MKLRNFGIILIILLMLSSIALGTEANTGDKVYVVPINGEINRATNYFVKDTIKELESQGAKAITSSALSTLLLAIGLIGIVVEIFTPGFGLGGIASIIAFGLYFGGNILAGNSNWISLTFFVIGLILIVIEGMVPGFGLPGISGIIAIVVGIIMAMNNLSSAISSLSIAIILTTIVIIIFVKLGYRSKIFNNIILSNELLKDKGYIPSEDMEHLLGEEGRALSELRPAGFIEIGNNKYDALSDGGFIVRNDKIKVVKVEGSKIFVRRI